MAEASLAPPQMAPPQPAAPEAEPARQVDAAPGNAALAAAFGPQVDDSFLIDIGPAPGLRIAADETGQARIDLSDRARPIAGIVLDSAAYNRSSRQRRVSITGHLDVPHVRDNQFTLTVSDQGHPSLDLRAGTELPALGNPEIRVSIGEDRSLTASVTIQPTSLVPRALGRNLTITGGGTITLANGKLSGEVTADLAYPRLGAGAFDLGFNDAGRLSGSGHVELTTAFLGGTRAALAVSEEGGLAASVDIPAASIAPNIAGLSIDGGTVHLAYDNAVVSGAINALMLSYPGLGSASISAQIAPRGQIEGNGQFDLHIGGFADATGAWAFRNGAFDGSVAISARQFPEALPVRGGQITATLGPEGAVSFAGQVGVSLGPAGDGQLRAGYDAETGAVAIGATVNLTIPGLQGASFRIDYLDGRMEGEGEVPIDTELLPGITGNVHVTYREGRWAGETELTYSADDGKLSGTIRIDIAQTEAGALQVTGGGEVTAQIAPRLQGTLHAEILPEGGVDVSGRITVSEPLEMFPEWRADRELFRYSQNIPLWAMLVAVIRMRAGIRAGVGPGVFRNITVEGSYTVGQEGEPSFSITGEMFIPAFVEAYVAFGAGLGLDVVLGSLTGGIEGTASAGLYGAISVVPELSYNQGDYGIEGTATLAAGARLKLGLNAWAEIEALWVTVWEETWQLGEWVWNIGPDLALQAHMAYNFSNPAPPTIDFSTSDIDTDSMIEAAMPKDGPDPSGAREALQNRAEWQGALREPGPDANAVPPDLAQQADAPPPTPPAPAPRPPRQARPSGGGAPPPTPERHQGGAALPGAAPASGANRPVQPSPAIPVQTPATTPDQADPHAVAAAARAPDRHEEALPPEQAPPATGQPRYPGAMSIGMLNDPPAQLPRTAEEQQQDLDAANAVVSLIEQQVEDTDALEAYFPRIKRRFQLSEIELVANGPNGACVKLAINPVRYNEIGELLRGADLARPDGLALRTQVRFYEDSLAGRYPVGTKMEATMLGPDHPAGGPPRGQEALLGKLPTRTGEEVGNYIRGHLLNDNVGGPGEPKNLFPITQRANRLHEQYVESTVKRWVNQDRYWVFYSVAITDEKDNLHNPDPPYFVDAKIVTEAAVLTVNQQKSTKLAARGVTVRSQATIADNEADVAVRPDADPNGATVSVVSSANTAEQAMQDAGVADVLPGHQAQAFDRSQTIQESTRSRRGGTTAAIRPEILQAVQDLRARSGFRWARVYEAVQSTSGLGLGTADLLIECIKDPDRLASLEPAQKGRITAANNLASKIVAALAQFM